MKMTTVVVNKCGFGVPLGKSVDYPSIKKALTFYEPETEYNKDRPKKFIKCYWSSKNYLYIPRYYGLKQFGYQISFDYPDAQKLSSETVHFNGSLRDYQTKIVNNIVNNQLSGLLQMGTGTGKTITSMGLINKLQLKTLIIVHKIGLMVQWQKQLNQFLPNASVGIIQGPKFEVENDIVIGMLQTLTQHYPRYGWDTFKSFGIVIIDECQHICAEQFSKILMKVQTKYRYGLSATPRGDCFQNVITYHIGPVIATHSRESLKPHVQMHVLDHEFVVPKTYKNKVNYSRLLNDVSFSDERNESIVDIIAEVQKDYDYQRSIIVFAHRIKQIDILFKLLNDHETISDCCTISKLIGKMKKDEREEAAKADIIIATYSLAKEGEDIPKLDTILLAAPIGAKEVRTDGQVHFSDCEQAVGRILRRKNKLSPLVLDIQDRKVGVFYRQYRERLKFYHSRGFVVERC